MAVVIRILSYLKGALAKELIFRKYGHMEIKGVLMPIGQGTLLIVTPH